MEHLFFFDTHPIASCFTCPPHLTSRHLILPNAPSFMDLVEGCTDHTSSSWSRWPSSLRIRSCRAFSLSSRCLFTWLTCTRTHNLTWWLMRTHSWVFVCDIMAQKTPPLSDADCPCLQALVWIFSSPCPGALVNRNNNLDSSHSALAGPWRVACSCVCINVCMTLRSAWDRRNFSSAVELVSSCFSSKICSCWVLQRRSASSSCTRRTPMSIYTLDLRDISSETQWRFSILVP